MKKFDLVRRASMLAAGSSVTVAVEFVAGIVLVRLLSESDWSVLALALTIYQTAVGIGGLNIQDGVFFFYTRVSSERRVGLALQTITMLLSSGTLIAAGLLLLGPLLDRRGLAIGPLIPWIAAAIVLELPTSCVSQLLVSAEKPGWATVFNTTLSIIKLLATALPLAFGLGVVSAAQGLAAQALLRLLVSIAVLPRALPKGRWRVEWSLLKEQIVYTAPLALSIGSIVLNKYVDKWIVAAVAPEGFGNYALASIEVPFVSLLGFAMATVLATRITHAFQVNKPERALAYWLGATSRVSLIVGPLTIGLILCAPEGFALLFAPSYALSVLPFQIFSVIMLHRVMAYGLMLRAAGATRALWLATLVMLGLNVVLALPLTYWFGIPGTATGTLLAYAFNLVFYLSCIARTLGVSLGGVFPWGHYARILVCALLAAAFAYAAGRFVESTAVRLLAKATVFALSYAGMARVLAVNKRVPSIPEDDELFLEDVAAKAPSIEPSAAATPAT